MPEGNVIHHQARRLSRAFKGTAVRIDSPQGRFAEGAALVDKHLLTGAEAYGKHLYLGFDNGLWIHIHLGLFGKWRFGTGTPPTAEGQLRLRMQNGRSWAELRGPTVCEVLDDAQKETSLAKVGPDPIRKDADPERAWHRVHRSSQSIGQLLMDQTVFAGVGNIYRAEVLFRHRISPYREGKDITRKQFDAIWADLATLMTAGTRSGRIDTVRDEHMPEAMGRPPREDRHGGEVYVYRRADQRCYLCESKVRMADMAGRNLYWCPRCQRK